MIIVHSDFVASVMTIFFMTFIFSLGLYFGKTHDIDGSLIYLTLIFSAIGTALSYYSPHIKYMLKEGH